jgi:hypothetical protein
MLVQMGQTNVKDVSKPTSTLMGSGEPDANGLRGPISVPIPPTVDAAVVMVVTDVCIVVTFSILPRLPSTESASLSSSPASTPALRSH